MAPTNQQRGPGGVVTWADGWLGSEPRPAPRSRAGGRTGPNQRSRNPTATGSEMSWSERCRGGNWAQKGPNGL